MNSPQPFLLIGISPEPFRPEQQKLVNSLFQQGLDYLYIRSRESDSGRWRQILEEIDPVFYSRLLLPANAPAEAAGGQYIRHIREAERQAGGQAETGAAKLYSSSIHRLAALPELRGTYKFVFYSPVFPSISKAGYKPLLDLPEIERQMAGLRKEGGMPRVIGLGGVCAGNIRHLQAAGFQGAALLGALWQASGAERALAEIQASLRDCRG